MLDARDEEIQEVQIENRKLEKKLRKSEIRVQEADVETNDFIQELENQKEAYRYLQE